MGGSIRWGSIRWVGLYGGSIWWGVYKGGWVYTVGGLYRGVYLVGILYGMRSIGGVYCFFFPFGYLGINYSSVLEDPEKYLTRSNMV